MLWLDKQNYLHSRLNLDHEKRAVDLGSSFFENPELTSANVGFSLITERKLI
jgi:hypothetical protein